MNTKKDKILFWLENHTIHFGISKALTDKYDCDSYALIACSPKQKKFFKNQKLVKFKKIWFLRDNIDLKNHEPNVKNLKFLENKFSIPLGKIIYGERTFYKYNKYYSFTDQKILSIIEQELEFYEKILDEINPDFVVMRAPEFHDIELFYELCKTKKIPLLVLSLLKLGQQYIISSESYPLIHTTSDNKIEIKSFESLEKHIQLYSKTFHSFLRENQPIISQKFNALKLLFSTFNSSNINSYRDLGRTPWKTFLKTSITMLKGHFRKSYLNRTTKTSFSLNQPYAYFPLHFEPDVALLRMGDFYTEQLGVIKNIVQSLPIEMNLLVKEHPLMKVVGWRKLEFYKEIQKLPKVKLIHPSFPKESLIKNSSFVITIAGTTALEAAVYQKPSVVFSDVNCSTLSCVFKVNNLEDLPTIIKKCLNSKVDLVELNHFFHQVEKSTFSCDVENLNTIFSNVLGVGGFLNINEISESKMKKILDENKTDFDLLGTEHIKKIEDFKKNN